MKKLRNTQISLRKHALRTPALLTIAVMLAGTFWAATASNGQDDEGSPPPMCEVCHKRNSTISLPCGSTAYRRHLDHGDPMGACATPTVAP